MGKVKFVSEYIVDLDNEDMVDHAYIVDLDNEDMVDHAKDAIFDDVRNVVKYNEILNWIKIEKMPKAKPSDIPEFLLEVETE